VRREESLFGERERESFRLDSMHGTRYRTKRPKSTLYYSFLWLHDTARTALLKMRTLVNDCKCGDVLYNP
jgi:hypothetical protein